MANTYCGSVMSFVILHAMAAKIFLEKNLDILSKSENEIGPLSTAHDIPVWFILRFGKAIKNDNFFWTWNMRLYFTGFYAKLTLIKMAIHFIKIHGLVTYSCVEINVLKREHELMIKKRKSWVQA